METNQIQNDEVEIDLKEVFGLLWSKAIWIIICGVIFAGIAGVYTKLMITPQFKSSSMLYIKTNSNSISISDLQLGSSLTEDYMVLVKSRPVVEQVIENLNLNIEYEDMLEKITVTNPSNTRIIQVTATDPVPSVAKEIVDEFAQVAAKQMSEIMKTDKPSIVEEGTIANSKSSPSTTKNCAIAGLIGMVLVCAIIVIRFMMDDTIKSPDDIEKYLGLTTLGIIPDSERDEKHVKAKIQGDEIVYTTKRGKKIS